VLLLEDKVGWNNVFKPINPLEPSGYYMYHQP
jgi:hypothetical protein